MSKHSSSSWTLRLSTPKAKHILLFLCNLAQFNYPPTSVKGNINISVAYLEISLPSPDLPLPYFSDVPLPRYILLLKSLSSELWFIPLLHNPWRLLPANTCNDLQTGFPRSRFFLLNCMVFSNPWFIDINHRFPHIPIYWKVMIPKTRLWIWEHTLERSWIPVMFVLTGDYDRWSCEGLRWT